MYLAHEQDTSLAIDAVKERSVRILEAPHLSLRTQGQQDTAVQGFPNGAYCRRSYAVVISD